MYGNDITEAKMLPSGINVELSEAPSSAMERAMGKMLANKGNVKNSIKTIFQVLQDRATNPFEENSKTLRMIPAEYPHENIYAIKEEQS
jgi:hypothetical protein